MLPVGPRLGQVWSLNMRAGVSTCMCIKPFAMWLEHGMDEQRGGGWLLPRSLYLYTCLEAINIHVSLRYRIFINPTNGSGVGKEPKLIQSSELQEFCGL